MKKLSLLIFITLVTIGCKSDGNDINGTYKIISKEQGLLKNILTNQSVIESLSFDKTAVSFGGAVGDLLPAAKYQVKEGKVYIESQTGIFIFQKPHKDTLIGETLPLKGIYVKK